jgi:hypothetical protein
MRTTYHQRHPAVASAQEVRLTHLVGTAPPGRCRSTGSCARRAGAPKPKPAAEKARKQQSGGERAQEGGKAPGRNLLRSAAIRGNSDQTRARATSY